MFSSIEVTKVSYSKIKMKYIKNHGYWKGINFLQDLLDNIQFDIRNEFQSYNHQYI